MPFERYEILLPLNYNDGTPIEPEKFQETRRELVEQFGALTMDAPAIAGLWVSGGREYRDELLRFVIDTEATADTDAFFRDLKERLKERFRQIEIWIRRLAITTYPAFVRCSRYCKAWRRQIGQVILARLLTAYPIRLL